MSKKFDELMAFLDAALPPPETVRVCCRGCGPNAVDKIAHLDEAGDTSPGGHLPYVCRACRSRFTSDGYSPHPT